MPSFFSNKRLIVLLVGTILLVVLIGLTIDERPAPTAAEQFVQDSVGFFQSLVYRPARSVAGLFDDIEDIRNVYSQNQKLKENLQENAQLMAQIRLLEEENKSLRQVLEAEQSLTDYKLRSASVINRSPDRWYQRLMIDRGEQHGIKANMAVLSPEGHLLGRITNVSQYFSDVELISDANRAIQISAVVQGDEQVYGVLDGYDSTRQALMFSLIPKEAELEVGQTVITYGLGGIFPRGLYVGEVIDTMQDDYGLTQSALVQPAANLYQLDYVLIVERSHILVDPDSPDVEGGEGS